MSIPSSPPAGRHLALLVHTLAGGGIERVVLTLARAFAACGHRVDVLACRPDGRTAGEVPAGVRVVPLRAAPRPLAHGAMVAADPGALGAMGPILRAIKPPWEIRHLPALARYLKAARPDIVLAGNTPVNLIALWARRLVRSKARVFVTEHGNFSAQIASARHRARRAYPALVHRAYGEADGIIAVSHGLADDLARCAGLPRGRIATIPNPVSGPEIDRLAAEPLDHPWFGPDQPPVILTAGRLSQRQKDYATLLRAFAHVRAVRPVRLLVLGDGRDRGRIEHQARLAAPDFIDDIAFPGWVDNPFAYMARAAVFVLSSPAEGFGNVLVEAMACGCPVVSTDSPYGPGEILDRGRYGALTPVGDASALAEALLRTLEVPPSPDILRRRAADFSVERVVDEYLALLLGPASGASSPDAPKAQISLDNGK
ncbi:MAG: glycosyltransferase [Alphaproteobacteria bacterium]|nr:MAG: glycosyltransferase [Alphaproteobacteria bacterium]